MKFFLTGVETNNKGAELMLYAILNEIEHKFPSAEVYISSNNIKQGRSYVKTPINLIIQQQDWKYKYHIVGLLKRLGLNMPKFCCPPIIEKADYYIDASGFRFSDNFYYAFFDNILLEEMKRYKSQSTKIVFLPQAFGPIKRKETKKVIVGLSKYADVIMPREIVSFNFLKEADVDMNKVRMFTDFTSLVLGVFPDKYEHLRGGICVIPNSRMISQGVLTFGSYINIISNIVDLVTSKGYKVYILNHEGQMDKNLIIKMKEHLGPEIEAISDLNALEVKGLIESSYLCISSRFHGVASSLNSSVPCLATSWSHKYYELFKDFGMDDCVLDLKNIDSIKMKIEEFLEFDNNKTVREKLYSRASLIKEETKNMWNYIWSI